MIYFIQAPSGAIKIGRSDWVAGRLKTLRKVHSPHLKVLGVRNGGREEEAELHWRFRVLRLDGEWFRPWPELLEYIEKETVVWTGDDRPRLRLDPFLFCPGDKPTVHVWKMSDEEEPDWSRRWRFYIIWRGYQYDFDGPRDYCHSQASARGRGYHEAVKLAASSRPDPIREAAR